MAVWKGLRSQGLLNSFLIIMSTSLYNRNLLNDMLLFRLDWRHTYIITLFQQICNYHFKVQKQTTVPETNIGCFSWRGLFNNEHGTLMHYNHVKLKREQDPTHYHTCLPYIHDPGSRLSYSWSTKTESYHGISLDTGNAAQKTLSSQVQHALYCPHLHLGGLRNWSRMARG